MGRFEEALQVFAVMKVSLLTPNKSDLSTPICPVTLRSRSRVAQPYY